MFPQASIAREPSIAVLPFANMSGDPAQDYVGSGIAEDIITILSSYPTVRVVSRTSSFVYDKPVKVQQVGQELSVNYVIEGSVKKAGGKVRVTAQLIDAVSGDHVWADRYDEEGDDVAIIQDDVANRIYSTLAGLRGEIMKKEEAQAWNKSGPSLEEYDYYLRGHQTVLPLHQGGQRQGEADLAGGIGEISRFGAAADEDRLHLLPEISSTNIPMIRGATRNWDGSSPRRPRQSRTSRGWRACCRIGAWLPSTTFTKATSNARLTKQKRRPRWFRTIPLRAPILPGYLISAGRTDRAIEWLEEVDPARCKPHGLVFWQSGRRVLFRRPPG